MWPAPSLAVRVACHKRSGKLEEVHASLRNALDLGSVHDMVHDINSLCFVSHEIQR